MPDTGKYKAILEERLSELQRRLKEIDEELESHSSRDWEELAVERETDEVLEHMGLSGQAEIRAINAALKRIEDDTFGFCAKCGEELSPERLEVVPYAPLCRQCVGAKKQTV